MPGLPLEAAEKRAANIDALGQPASRRILRINNRDEVLEPE
jgi:hypothetical protein